MSNKTIKLSKKDILFLKEYKEKRDLKTFNTILEEIERLERGINESQIIQEGIVDTLKKYAKKGLLTLSVMSALLGSGKVNAQQLQQAGADRDQIVQAQQQSGGSQQKQGTMTDELKKVERVFLRVLKKRDQVGTIKQYENLDQYKKINVLQSIYDETNGDYSQIDRFQYRLDKSGKELGDSFIEIGREETIRVDTVKTTISFNIGAQFKPNSVELENPQKMQQEIQNLLNGFYEVDSIIIKSSSSTLRNTGEIEGLTWKQSSTLRGEAVENIVNGMQYNLGGCGMNPTKTIESSQIQINSSGQNGDGTSGPPSPFPASSYIERGIDDKFWKSDATGEPYSNVEQYNQHQYVIVEVTGIVISTDTDKILNIDYFKMFEMGGERVKISDSQPSQPRNVMSCAYDSY